LRWRRGRKRRRRIWQKRGEKSPEIRVKIYMNYLNNTLVECLLTL
jgi:hypothetical protein